LLIVLFGAMSADADSTDAAAPEPETGTEAMAAANESPTTASAPPPIGVRFGEPLHDQRFRLTYFFERIRKSGLLISDKSVSPSDIFNRVPPSVVYNEAPRSLVITTHTFQLAYSPHPRVTLIAEVPFVQRELKSVSDMDVRSQVETEGVGDINFAMVLPFIRKRNESSHVHVGVKVPTGSIRRGGRAMPDTLDSQIGNGTVDLEWGWTYLGFKDQFSWGGQVFGRHPVGRNGRDYRVGSRFEASFWGAVELIDGLSGSLRMSWEKQNNIRVRHRIPNSDIQHPSNNPKARGGTRFSIHPGLTLEVPGLANQRIAVEFDLPFYQDLDGPQLEQDWSVTAGWRWGF